MENQLLCRIASRVLLAGRKEDVVRKYPDLINEINSLIEHDPSGSLKYLDWQCGMLDSGRHLEEVLEVTELFDRLKSRLDKKDVNQYKITDFNNLRDRLFYLDKDRQEKEDKSIEVKERNEIINKLPPGKYDTIYKSDKFRVVHVQNKSSAVHYGEDTKWCISEAKAHHFEDYDSNNTLIFMILTKGVIDPRENTKEKISLSVQRGINNEILEEKWWLADDENVDQSVVKDYVGNEFDKIYSRMMSVAKSYPKSVLAKLVSGEIVGEEAKREFDKLHIEQQYGVISAIGATQFNEEPDEGLSGNLITVDLMHKFMRHGGNPAWLAHEIIHYSNDRKFLYELFESEEFNHPLAANKNITPEMFEYLAKYGNDNVRRSVAGNDSTPAAVVNLLAHDEEEDVRSLVADNPKAYGETLRLLSKDTTRIKLSVSMNPSTPVDVLEALAEDEDVNVRIGVMSNKSSPPEIVNRLKSSDTVGFNKHAKAFWKAYYHEPKCERPHFEGVPKFLRGEKLTTSMYITNEGAPESLNLVEFSGSFDSFCKKNGLEFIMNESGKSAHVFKPENRDVAEMVIWNNGLINDYDGHDVIAQVGYGGEVWHDIPEEIMKTNPKFQKTSGVINLNRVAERIVLLSSEVIV